MRTITVKLNPAHRPHLRADGTLVLRVHEGEEDVLLALFEAPEYFQAGVGVRPMKLPVFIDTQNRLHS